MKLEELSIAIIAKKEKENIELFLNDLLEYSDDVFVVDSNSNDGTKELYSKYNIRYINDNNLGKGDGQRVAVVQAKYENIIFLMAMVLMTRMIFLKCMKLYLKKKLIA